MQAKTPQPNELAVKLKCVAPHVLRCTVNEKDYVFVPGKEYENLPAHPYVIGLWKQGYFTEVVKAKGKRN